MRITLLLSCLTLYSTSLFSQVTDFSINNQIINQIPESVPIVGLGDPTHQESTITNYRIDLIKRLVSRRQFKIIAIEGNIYELYKAYTHFLNDSKSSHFEKAMYPMLNLKEMEALYQFVYEENQNGNPIKLVGFDPAFSGEIYVSEVKRKLDSLEILNEDEKLEFIKLLNKAVKTNFWSIFRNNKAVKESIVTYAKKVSQRINPKSLDDAFFLQTLDNLIFLYGDSLQTSAHNKRDLGMTQNIDFLQQAFSNEKIILFGSSTHLLKNPSSINTRFHKGEINILGNELNKKSKNNYYYVAYSGLSGYKWKLWNKEKRLPQSIDGSIEQQVNKDLHEEAAFYTKKSSVETDAKSSRFLGHQFVSLDIWEVMDMIVLIRNIQPSKIIKTIGNNN